MAFIEGLLAGENLMVVLASVAAMAAVIAAAIGLRAVLAPGREQVVERIARTVGVAVQDAPVERGQTASVVARVLRPLSWLARPTRAAELSQLRLRMSHAGLRTPHALEIFLGVKILLAAVAAIGMLEVNSRVLAQPVRFPFNLVAVVWLCGAAFFAPNLWLRGRIVDRQTQIGRGLPDAMDLLVTCVEAGLGLDAALSRVADEIGLASPLLGRELNLTFLEVQAGMTRADAFRRLAERTGVEELRQLSAMLIQSDLFGTSIARALRVHADGMRTRRMQRAEERAAMVGVKMTIPLVLMILPSLIAVLLGPAVVSIIQKLFPAMGAQ